MKLETTKNVSHKALNLVFGIIEFFSQLCNNFTTLFHILLLQFMFMLFMIIYNIILGIKLLVLLHLGKI